MVTDMAVEFASGGVELVAAVETSTCAAGVGPTLGAMGSADRAGWRFGAGAGVLTVAGPSAGGAGSLAGRSISLTDGRSVGADEIAAAGAEDLLRRGGVGVLSSVGTATATGRLFFPNSAPSRDRLAAGLAVAAIGASVAAARTLVCRRDLSGVSEAPGLSVAPALADSSLVSVAPSRDGATEGSGGAFSRAELFSTEGVGLDEPG